MNKIHWLVILIICICLGIAQTVKAQDNCSVIKNNSKSSEDDHLNTYNNLGVTNCEAALRNLEDVFAKAKETEDSYLIIILRLAENERARFYEERHNSIEAWVKRYYGDLNRKYIIAQGERVRDLGRVDFHISGKPYFGLQIKKNSRRVCIGD